MGEEIGQKGESWGRQKNENGAIVIEARSQDRVDRMLNLLDAKGSSGEGKHQDRAVRNESIYSSFDGNLIVITSNHLDDLLLAIVEEIFDTTDHVQFSGRRNLIIADGIANYGCRNKGVSSAR